MQWDYVRNFTNASLLVKDEYGWSDGLFTGYDEEKRDYDRTSWDYQIGEDGFALTDPTLQHPRCVWNLLKAHVDDLHARDGRADLRHAAGQVPADRRDDRRMLVADQDDDVDVRARLDPARQGRAEHPRHGDAAADPRQHRRARRRHERAARAFQHPGPDRRRADVEPAPRLSQHADGEGGRLRDLHVDAGVQAAPARADQLLAELPQVHGLAT